MSSSTQLPARNRNEVFMAITFDGDTAYDPGRGAPFVTTETEEKADDPVDSRQVSEKTYVDL